MAFNADRHEQFLIHLENMAEGMRLLSTHRGVNELHECGDRLEELVNAYKRDSAITLKNMEPVYPQHYIFALGEISVKEARGSADHPRVVWYHSHTAAGEASDATPWCSSFVCACLEECGVRSTRSKAAKSYLSYGDDVIDNPTFGDIVVMDRGGWFKGSNLHHVAFWAGETATHVILLGGNQDDMVCKKEYPKGQVEAIRRPKATQGAK